jgi:hypothetical protein
MDSSPSPMEAMVALQTMLSRHTDLINEALAYGKAALFVESSSVAAAAGHNVYRSVTSMHASHRLRVSLQVHPISITLQAIDIRHSSLP